MIAKPGPWITELRVVRAQGVGRGDEEWTGRSIRKLAESLGHFDHGEMW